MGEAATALDAPGGLIQAWLFFGLLQDFFQIGELTVDMRYFVQQEGDQSFATTAQLKDHLDTLANRGESLKPEVRPKQWIMLAFFLPACLSYIFRKS